MSPARSPPQQQQVSVGASAALLSSALQLCLVGAAIGIALVSSPAAAAGATTLANSRTCERAVCRHPWVEVGKKCVFVDMSVSESWALGRRFCRQLHKGADLLIFHDANEYADVLNHIKTINPAKTPVSFWVGGSDTAVRDEWQWVTAELMPVGAPFWGVDEPNQANAHCALMFHRSSYYLTNAPCDGWDAVRTSPICEYDFFNYPLGGQSQDAETHSPSVK